MTSKWPAIPISKIVMPKETWSPAREPRTMFRYVDISAIDNDAGLITDAREIKGTEAPSRARKVIRRGDVLFATTRPYLKNIAIVPAELDGHICSTGFCVLRPNHSFVTTEWLYAVCRSDLVLDQVVPTQEKSTYPAVSDGEILHAAFPLPPLAEQRRIVSRIEALTGRLSEARRLHEEARLGTSQLFCAELKVTFSRKNTRRWPVLPFKQLAKPVAGQVDPRESPYIDMPHIGPNNIERGTGRLLRDSIQTARQLGLRSGKYLFGPQHVLYSKIRPALQKVAMPDFAGVCSADMYPLLPNAELISREFLALSLLSPAFTQHAIDHSDRNAMPKINRANLDAHVMPVPDKASQCAIAKELLGISKHARSITIVQDQIGDELNSFLPSLLAKAFRGEL